MLEQLLMLAAAVTAAVVFVRTALGKVPFWANLSDSTQSIVLQLLAFLFGLFGAWAQGLNAFPFTDAPLGLIFTGLAAALGAAPTLLGRSPPRRRRRLGLPSRST